MKLRNVLGSFAWVVLAAVLILVNAAAANAQDKATENEQTVQIMNVNKRREMTAIESHCGSFFIYLKPVPVLKEQDIRIPQLLQ